MEESKELVGALLTRYWRIDAASTFLLALTLSILILGFHKLFSTPSRPLISVEEAVSALERIAGISPEPSSGAAVSTSPAYKQRQLCVMANALITSGDVAISTGTQDGTPGVMALALALLALDKHRRVTIVTDLANAEVVMAAVAGCGVGGGRLRLEGFSALDDWGVDDEARLEEVAQQHGHLILCSRPVVHEDSVSDTMDPDELKRNRRLFAPMERLAYRLGSVHCDDESGCTTMALGMHGQKHLAGFMARDDQTGVSAALRGSSACHVAYALASICHVVDAHRKCKMFKSRAHNRLMQTWDMAGLSVAWEAALVDRMKDAQDEDEEAIPAIGKNKISLNGSVITDMHDAVLAYTGGKYDIYGFPSKGFSD